MEWVAGVGATLEIAGVHAGLEGQEEGGHGVRGAERGLVERAVAVHLGPVLDIRALLEEVLADLAKGRKAAK